ncbi:hypothetical protein BsWGS_00613 [Bradybaena similaris]
MIRRINSWREFRNQGSPTHKVSLNPPWSRSSTPEPPEERSKDAGEQPIFTTKAHVFQIDANTKKDWIPASKSSVSVSFYYDSARNTYRIISVDGSKAVVNSTVTPNMAFTKTSQKFGQWSDLRANTVYGLGFSSEQELSKFIEKFKEIKELTREAAQHKHANVNGVMDGNITSPQSTRQSLHQRTGSLSSIQNETGCMRERRNSFTHGGNNGPSSNSSEAHLKYENDRLKLALSQSSANAKKWEIELQTLKSNNTRLTAALQESTANVDEWKKQLAAFREENMKLKKRLLDQDKGGGGGSDPLLVSQLSEQIERLRLDSYNKQEEIRRLNSEVQELKARDGPNSSLQSRIQLLEEENHSLSVRLQDYQRQLQDTRTSKEQESRELIRLEETLGSRINELYETHKTIVAKLKQDFKS